MTIETDAGTWHVVETPGHAPSHVCLHQPEQRLLISGDHLLGRVSQYFDVGYTPDPIGEFLHSLDVVDAARRPARARRPRAARSPTSAATSRPIATWSRATWPRSAPRWPTARSTAYEVARAVFGDSSPRRWRAGR